MPIALESPALIGPATVCRLLVIGAPEDLPAGVRELLRDPRVEARAAASFREGCDPARLADADAVVVCPTPGQRWGPDVRLLADALTANRLTGVLLWPDAPGVASALEASEALMIVPQDTAAEELWGRLAAIRHCRGLLIHMEEQVAGMQRLGKKLNEQFVEVDQELRLASRLQRDFLPRHLPEVGPLRFAALYRPATWVSGDVYDVQRLDETHLAFYLADAVGHGVAAGLLTMFIKQAIVGKHVFGERYALVQPDEVLAHLNSQLADQQLPNCQFVTACYALIDAEHCRVSVARGGHPHPIHAGRDGTCSEVRTVGGLLGVFQDETFPSTDLVLEAGEKLVLYSDGLEDLIVARRSRDDGPVTFTPEFLEAVRLPAQQMVSLVGRQVDAREGSLEPDDDMTLVVVENTANPQ